MITVLPEPSGRPALDARRLFLPGVLSLLLHVFVLAWLAVSAGGSDGALGHGFAPVRLSVTFSDTSIPEGARFRSAEEFSPDFLQAAPAVVPAESAARPESGAPIESFLLPLPRYYVRSELTVPPRILTDPGFDDPQRFPTSDPGKLELRIFIDERGHVDSVAIISSTLPAAWARAAVDAFTEARFEPGRRGDLPVRSQIRMSVGVGDTEEFGR